LLVVNAVGFRLDVMRWITRAWQATHVLPAYNAEVWWEDKLRLFLFKSGKLFWQCDMCRRLKEPELFAGNTDGEIDICKKCNVKNSKRCDKIAGDMEDQLDPVVPVLQTDRLEKEWMMEQEEQRWRISEDDRFFLRSIKVDPGE
jgi:hypothetical protein